MTDGSRRRPGRPSGGKPVTDRERLLDAAERVIRRDGSGASLDAIAFEAGVTKPIVYGHVGSRVALSNALAERLADRLLAATGGTVTAGRLDRDALASLFRTTLETLGAHRELFLYVTRGAANDDPERALFLAARSAGPLADFVARWRADEGSDGSVAVPWAYAIVGMLNLVSLWWMEESTLPAAVVADQLAELVWPGLDGRS